MVRRLLIAALVIFAFAGWASAAGKGSTVTILTQNMDAGTDQSYIVAAAQGYLDPALAVDLTFAELQLGNLPGRAAALAARIANSKPDLVALQECTLWRAALTAGAPLATLYDQLAILRAALATLGAPYDVVAINSLNELTLPGRRIAALSFTDRNVLLVRAGARPPGLHFSDVHTHIFHAALPFAGLVVQAGWIEAEVHLENRHFRLVTTHLESTVPGVPEATEVQVAQAKELLYELRNLPYPVVLCGDFNSDANDNSDSYDMMSRRPRV
jgi:endonuclease/exonuclease/phosphatase family metal-dependent hydrolase